MIDYGLLACFASHPLLLGPSPATSYKALQQTCWTTGQKAWQLQGLVARQLKARQHVTPCKRSVRAANYEGSRTPALAYRAGSIMCGPGNADRGVQSVAHGWPARTAPRRPAVNRHRQTYIQARQELRTNRSSVRHGRSRDRGGGLIILLCSVLYIFAQRSWDADCPRLAEIGPVLFRAGSYEVRDQTAGVADRGGHLVPR